MGQSEPRLRAFTKQEIPWTPLASGPTPIRPLEALSKANGGVDIWLKDDGLASPIYGGNKVRKLEFLLARSLRRESRRLLTLGALGSHHALATAAFGQQLGFEVELYLYPQPINHHVLDNLLLDYSFGAQMKRIAHVGLAPFSLAFRSIRRGTYQGPLEIIPPGGSDPTGSLGYVEGALELAEQLEAGLCPRPGAIVVAAGTCGTAAGLACGLQLAGLGDIPIWAVQVVDGIVCNNLLLGSLTRLTARLLSRVGAPLPKNASSKLELLGGHLGAGYGHPTEDSQQALAQLEDLEGIRLDPTYTAKALSGLLRQGRVAKLSGPLLFWNTVNRVELGERAASVSPWLLPEAFRRDFASLQRLPSANESASP
jgi:D-cysteine desulfhydrase